MEALSEGRTVAAKQTIESAMDAIDDAGRDDLQTVDALAELPPVFLLDAELHKHRAAFLEKHAATHGWRFGWVGKDFVASDDAGFSLHVNAADAWRCSTGIPDRYIPGVGLTTLNAHLRGERLDATVVSLTKWYQTLKGAAK